MWQELLGWVTGHSPLLRVDTHLTAIISALLGMYGVVHGHLLLLLVVVLLLLLKMVLRRHSWLLSRVHSRFAIGKSFFWQFAAVAFRRNVDR
jgi:hypothetical protein